MDRKREPRGQFTVRQRAALVQREATLKRVLRDTWRRRSVGEPGMRFPTPAR